MQSKIAKIAFISLIVLAGLGFCILKSMGLTPLATMTPEKYTKSM